MFAVCTAKLTKKACQIAGKQGVTLAGKIALRLDPSILTALAGQVRENIRHLRDKRKDDHQQSPLLSH